MKILIPTLLLLSSTVMAADLKFNAEGRFDYANSTVKHEQVTTTNNYEEKRGEFTSNALRLNAVATFSENLLFRMRYRFSTAQEAVTKNRDLSFQNVDFFYVDHKTEFLTARLGKSNQADSLGREFYVAGTDYPTTFTTSYTSSNSAVYNAVKADADLYHVGATLMFNQIPNSTLSIAAFNPQKTTTYTDGAAATNDAKNSKFGLGFYYNGSFMEKMLQPTLGYTTFSIAPETDTTAANTTEGTHKLMSVGIRSEIVGMVVDLDWKQYKKANVAVVNATSNADKTTSIWANVAYTWDNLTPFVNYINDKYTKSADATVAYKRNAISAGLMIKPIKDLNFRYHLTYTNDVKKLDAATSGDKKVTANQIAAGIKFDI
ncbi:MAG: hypothetical protein Q7U04_16295 [Bacteriovorax sp.]|nr:hypothetical protein [Bacteriovorax sp.]